MICSFLTCEYVKCNERVIEMKGKFIRSILPSLRCKLFPHIYDEITKFDLVKCTIAR